MSLMEKAHSRDQLGKLVTLCQKSPEQVAMGEMIDLSFEALVLTEEGCSIISRVVSCFPYPALEGILDKMTKNLEVLAFKLPASRTVVSAVRAVVRNEIRISFKNFIETSFDKLVSSGSSCQIVIEALNSWPGTFISKILRKSYGRLIALATSKETFPLAEVLISKANHASQSAFMREVQTKKGLAYLVTHPLGSKFLRLFLASVQDKSLILGTLEKSLKLVKDDDVKEEWMSVIKGNR